MARALDPMPQLTRRWLRRQVVRRVQRGGRLSARDKVRRTERQHEYRSPLLKTSAKKLNLLARQVAGKPVDEALLQMRFSRKKVAQEVRDHLEMARDEAVVMRGMGLGKAEGTAGDPTEVELKNGQRRLVTDRTGIYVAEAWVTKGSYGLFMDYRARGRRNRLRIPYTRINYILKEEHTRVREHQERERKRANRKLWVPLPDRPVTAQHQYYKW
ncbi:ribosomal protein L22/L17 [Lineolata rhizophorae]|uniref:Ribosomal protein L22/L17 n=1 Tax=Lineolata rhizophorae TaxID=578093 RepID=A0A6A6P342_9PEZI|nr:ribosomal protein L22/L17 [Lineolata rhizophorae]